MTEKRFQEYYQGDKIVSIHDKENNNELLNILQCVALLNEQHEEIQSLKREIENNIDSFKRSRSRRIQVEEENEQLKARISKLQSKYDKSKTDEVDILVETENTVVLDKSEFQEYVRRHNELRRRNKRRKEKNRKYRNELKKRLREISGLKEFIAEDLSSEDKVLKGFIEEYL